MQEENFRDELGSARIGRGGGSGRASRRARREAGKREPSIWAGASGGQYRPLSDASVERIHKAALEILETVGIGDPTEELLDIVLPKGCFLNEHGRLCFPPSLIEDVLAGAAKEYRVHARGARKGEGDVISSGTRVHFCTAGSAVTTLDSAERTYRASTLLDLYDFARLLDRLDNIHLVGQTVVATDVTDDFEHDINVFYALMAATEKPLSMSFRDRGFIKPAIEMFDLVLGGEGRFVKEPFAIFGGCPIVSPLRFGRDNLDVMIETSQLGLVSDLAIAPQAGATAPASLAGTLVQVAAEMLACLAVVNLIKKGCPMTCAMWPLVTDLRTGSFSGGSGEEALLASAAVQIGNFYSLPTSVGASMSDSKIPDAQAGYEKGITLALAALAGCNRVCEAAGMLGSLLGCSFESLVIDNDIIGMALRAVRGIEVDDTTLAVEVIKETALDPGHYLGHPQTLAMMESEYVYPELSDRDPPGAWEETGSQDALQRAQVRAREILSSHYPNYIAHVDADIRERFNIKLAIEDMAATSGRW